ncbi:MAG TPA: vWA domain-containing protein [Pirellulales bacterium]|nr:vWA domain-containing protein [Pirellulales bacterium]
MSFAYPAVLLLLVVPVALWFWMWRHDARPLVLPLDHSRVGRGRWLRAAVLAVESLGPLLLAVVIVILAGPQRFGEPQSKRVLTNIEFCVDISGSMTAELGEGTRYDASMAAINEFLNFRQGDAFGLTFFGNNFLHWAPLTQDPSAIRCSTPFMRPETAPPWFGGTEIGKALQGCREVLTSRQEGDRMILLITDGMSFDIQNGMDQQLAKELSADRIVVYAVHVAEGDPPGPVVNIANLTGGEAFSAGDQEGVNSVFRRIDQMQQTRIERSLPEPQDNFVPYCIAGLSIVGLATLGLFGMRYTPW